MISWTKPEFALWLILISSSLSLFPETARAEGVQGEALKSEVKILTEGVECQHCIASVPKSLETNTGASCCNMKVMESSLGQSVANSSASLGWILDTSPYPPRWYCGNWAPAIGWLHIVSDLLTWLAYLIIPGMLIYFARKRDAFPFNRLFWLFGAFILFCGTTHLMEAIIFWWPAYGLAGVIKLGTAVVSLGTAAALRKAIPNALALRSPGQLEQEVQAATRASEEARQRAIRIIEASPVSMVMVDCEGVIRLTNQATENLFGYSRREMLGNNVDMLVPTSHRHQHKKERMSFQKNPTTRHMALGRELYGLHQSGRQLPIEISLNPVDSNPESDVLCSILDLEERKRSARRLQRHASDLARANDDLERFAYVASHDLKSPLRAIDNLSKWVLKDCGESLPEKSHRHLDQLRGRVGRMESLLDDLLSYSRAGRMENKAESFDCQLVVQEVIETLDIPESFTIETHGTFPTLNGRKTALRQVLMNLISNAIKHHDRVDGCVSIRAESNDQSIIFTVEDDGPGISPDFHERAFRPFQTLQSRDKVEGSGLGLAIVQRLIEQEGGSIVLESKHGQGCQFKVIWPLECVNREMLNH